jgi:ribonuclease-3
VRTEQLAFFAREINLGAALRLGRGELAGGGRARDALLCDAFEALVGAIYLYGEGELDSVRKFIIPFFEKVSDAIMLQPDVFDAKSRLQEKSQRLKLGIPKYKAVEDSGPDHAKEFTIEVIVKDRTIGVGKGPNKQMAQQNAAADALDKIDDIDWKDN